MAKNIIIFSDGTGQVGGLRPDERRSNVYKLYRATRCGPDTSIDPAEQVTYYDAGLGSMPPEGALFAIRAYRWLHNLFSLATGLGITTNIVDCYAAILSMWQPGDRIFVIGFSRAAYTVRCLRGAVAARGADHDGRRKDATASRREIRQEDRKRSGQKRLPACQFAGGREIRRPAQGHRTAVSPEIQVRCSRIAERQPLLHRRSIPSHH
jgi:uncharacterized protein (DUF2235 family)